jgi:putative tricarboxylic transport membrane protein
VWRGGRGEPEGGEDIELTGGIALGSRHYVRDAIIAVVLSVGSWYLFVLGLGIALPVGVLRGIL